MRIFLVIPFRKEFEDITLAIKQVAGDLGHQLIRMDELMSIGSITTQIQQEIKNSDLVIADISNHNANVMFELGFAISSSIPVLPLLRRGEQIPFDIATIRAIIYDRERLNDTLVRPLRSFLAHSNLEEYINKEITKLEKEKELKKTVFVSYSHADIAYLERLKIHLKPFEKSGQIDLWQDTKIKAGEKWKEKITQALEKSAIAILLISADFLASDFIVDNELPPLLQAAEEKGKTILPVILKPCRFTRDPNLSKFQAINNPNIPLSKLDENGREEIYVDIANYIDDSLK